MNQGRQPSEAATWGCLSAGMVSLGTLTIYVFEGVGGTDYEIKYLAAATIAGGVAILLLLVTHSLSDQQKFRLPRLNPFIAFAALAIIFFVLFF